MIARRRADVLNETAPAGTAPGIAVARVHLSIGAVELYEFSGHRHAFPRHAHEGFTIGALGADNGSIRVRGGTFRAREGGVLAIGPEEAHSAEPARGRGWTYRSICPAPAIGAMVLGAHAADASPAASAHFAFDRPVLDDATLARRVLALHRRLGAGTEMLDVEECLLRLLGDVVRRHGGWRASSLGPVTASAVRAARAVLDDRFGERISLGEIAAECALSPFQTIRAFRAALGVTPHAYLSQRRAAEAQQMLRAGVRISEVALRCGFADQSHLTRVFKRIYGITPGSYQRATRPSRPPPHR